MDAWLYYLWATVLVVACGAAWLMTLFSVPGNWLIAGFAATLTTTAAARKCRKIHDLISRKASPPTVLVRKVIETLVIFEERLGESMMLASFAHEHLATTCEYHGRHVSETLRTKAYGGFEQEIEILKFEKFNRAALLHRD